jgi:hypothetical protein
MSFSYVLNMSTVNELGSVECRAEFRKSKLISWKRILPEQVMHLKYIFLLRNLNIY